jgi:uncharacterized iron-regulated membrane protein
MTVKKLFFWLHLTTGVIVGLVVLIMSVTGVLLMYEKQIIAWAEQQGYRSAPQVAARRLPVEKLISQAREARNAMPATMTLRADPAAPVAFSFGREAAVFVNPYSAQVLGESSRRLRGFFRTVTDWHRWLGAQGPARANARAVTGACNLAFLAILLSGFYLWWPKRWTPGHLRPITWFRRNLSGKARDFNWHNTIGFWCVIPLFFVVISGVVISYRWAGDLVYRVAGTTPAAQPARPGGPGERPDGGSGVAGREVPLEGLDRLWGRAEQQVADWKSITMRIPISERAPVAFTIDSGNAGQPQKRGTLTLNRKTGQPMRWEPFEALDAGRRLRSWLRFVHTGEYYGLVGQTVAGVASAGAVFLVYTGIALSIRRFVSWRVRRSSRQQERALVEG